VEHRLDSDLRELNSRGEDVVGCLNRVAMVVASTRAVADIRAVEALRHSIQVLSITRLTTRVVEVLRCSTQVLSISHVSTRDVEVHAPEEEEEGCRSHTMAGIKEVVLDRVFHLVNQDQVYRVFHLVNQDQVYRVFHLVHRDQVYKVFLLVHRDQFPSCTKPHMSNIKPRWHRDPHPDLAHPCSLLQR
jgi:hypothetical protein